MDLILLKSFGGTKYKSLSVSYDIACQFSRNFGKRLQRYPEDLRNVEFLESIQWAIPKFHLAAHGFACQGPFSLNYLPFSARTDGEGIERTWAHTNPLGAATREMGPGHRRGTLDFHYSVYNWRKIVTAGSYLM